MQVVTSTRHWLPEREDRGLHQLPATNENLKQKILFFKILFNKIGFQFI